VERLNRRRAMPVMNCITDRKGCQDPQEPPPRQTGGAVEALSKITGGEQISFE
jgi:hypothetical protein